MTTSAIDVDWEQVRLVVFDVDGTLYDQRKLRIRMVMDLVQRVLVHPTELRLLRAIAAYRRCREELALQELADVSRLQYEVPAERLGIGARELEELVTPWIQERPLRFLRRCRYPEVGRLFAELRHSGRKIAALSDYPARDKLRALDLEVDLCVSAVDPEVDRLKPHPAGLRHVMESMGIGARHTLMIGDRDDRDGECARRAGVPYLLRCDRVHEATCCFSHYHDLRAIQRPSTSRELE